MKITKHEIHGNRELLSGREAEKPWKGVQNGEFWGIQGGPLAFVQCV